MSLVAALSPIPVVCSTCEQQTVLVRVANDSDVRAANPTSPLIPSSSWQTTSSHKGASARNSPVNARTTSARVHPAAAGVNGARAANLVRPQATPTGDVVTSNSEMARGHIDQEITTL